MLPAGAGHNCRVLLTFSYTHTRSMCLLLLRWQYRGKVAGKILRSHVIRDVSAKGGVGALRLTPSIDNTGN